MRLHLWYNLAMKCKFCNRDTNSKDKKPRTRCNSCNTKIRRTRNKIVAIFYLGGECQKCELKATRLNLPCFDFHHKDPNQKDFSIGRVANKAWESIQTELDKCLLLCSNCHRLEHANRYTNDLINESLNYKGSNITIKQNLRNLSDKGNTSG